MLIRALAGLTEASFARSGVFWRSLFVGDAQIDVRITRFSVQVCQRVRTVSYLLISIILVVGCTYETSVAPPIEAAVFESPDTNINDSGAVVRPAAAAQPNEQVRRLYVQRPRQFIFSDGSGLVPLLLAPQGELPPKRAPEPQQKPEPVPKPVSALEPMPALQLQGDRGTASYDPHQTLLPTGGLNRINDPHLHPTPPPVGVSLHETPLQTSVTRVTSNSRLGVRNGLARHHYSKQQAWNADETLLDAGGRLISMSDYSVSPATIAMSRSRNWSNLDPDIMYGIRFSGQRSNEFARYNVHERRSELIRRFDDFYTCRMGDGEGNISNDDRYVALVCTNPGQAPTLISFDIADNRILGQKRLAHDYNWAGFSQSGEFVVVEYSSGSSIDNQLLIFNQNLDHLRTVHNNIEHGDLAFDVDGNEIYLMIDALEMSYIELETGTRRELKFANSGSLFNHGHVSCRNLRRPGWCYFSNGEGVVGAVKIASPAEVEVWGFHRSSRVSYDVLPKASVSPSGSQVIFTSDWYGTGEINDYIVKLR